MVGFLESCAAIAVKNESTSTFSLMEYFII